MGAVIAMKGNETTMVVDGIPRQVIPFVGADRSGDFSSMGIGYFTEDGKGSIWGLVCPHALIRSWRGMKLLEKMNRIEHGTLCGCWTVITNNMHDSDKRHLDELAQQFSSREEFDAVLGEVLKSVPTPEELESMITALQEDEVDIDGWDLKAEVEAGRMEMTDQIQAILDAEEERRQAYKRKEEECNKVLAREESLFAFFEDLEIDNFIIGGGFGGYGMDWGHIKREELDRIAREESFSEHLKDGHRLERTTLSPLTMGAKAGPGVTVYQTSFGEIEQPYFMAPDGSKYTFVYAKWVEDKFYIRTIVEQEEMAVPPDVVEYTISQLRTLLDVKEKKLPFFKTQLQRVRQIFIGQSPS